MKTFYNAMRAEWIKMWSVRSTLIYTIIIAVLGIANSAFMAWYYKNLPQAHYMGDGFYYPPEGVLMGVTSAGIVVVLLFSITIVTNEYNTLSIEPTFRGVPRRPLVFLAKLVVAGLYMALVGLVVTFVSTLVSKLIALNSGTLDIFSADWAGFYWRIPVGFFLLTILSMGIGMIIRNTAGAVALLVVWITAIESILIAITPKVNFGPYLPFQNLSAFINGGGTLQMVHFEWNYLGAGGYFFGIAAALFIIGLFVTDPMLRKFQIHQKPAVAALDNPSH